jgi:sensor histidine kinase regulating citrate/malate metabolism
LLLVAVEVMVVMVVMVVVVMVMMVVVVDAVVVDAVMVRMWFRLRLRLVDQGQVVSRDVDIIYFLNNQHLTCPVSSAGWRVTLQRLKGSEFDSRCEHLFLYD